MPAVLQKGAYQLLQKEIQLSLQRLQAEIEGKLEEEHFPIENRPFQAHATIGRIKGRVNLPAVPTLKSELRLFNKIVLFQSTLSSDGPHYEILKTFSLSA